MERVKVILEGGWGSFAHTSLCLNGAGIRHNYMTQDELWLQKYQEVVAFIESNKRNPSKHSDEERGRYLNWLKHNKKLYAAGEMKEERITPFKKLLELSERYRRRNQYE